MDNFNSFKPPVDASNGEPILPTEPENSSATEHNDSPIPEPEEILEQNEFVSEKIGPTSNENGYGADSHGRNLERNDLDSSYYDKQANRHIDNTYATAESEIAAENQAFEDEWNAEYAEKERNDKIHLAIVALRDTIKDADARLDELEARIREESERAERILAEREKSKDASGENAPDAPTNTTALSATEARNDFSTAGSQPIDSTEAQNINKSSAVAPNTDTSIPPQGTTYHQGKDGLVYSDRQQAIDSFKD